MTNLNLQVSKNLSIRSFAVAKQEVVEVPGSTNYIYAVDNSYSMCSDLPNLRKDLKNKLPEMMNEGDTITLMYFSSGSNGCGIIQEMVKITDAKSLTRLNDSIDRFLQPLGATDFVPPLVLADEVIGRIKEDNSNPTHFIFLSDGGHNMSSWAEVQKAMEPLVSRAEATTIIEYGFYADTDRLEEMAETLGGTKIQSQNFNDYEVSLPAIFSGQPVGKIPLNIEEIKADMALQLLFVPNEILGGVTVFTTANVKEVLVPMNLDQVYYLAKTKVTELTYKDRFAPFAEGRITLAVVNALISRGRLDQAEAILSESGFEQLLQLFTNAFGKQKVMELIQTINYYAESEENYLKMSYNAKAVPNRKAYCLLDFIQDVMDDEETRLLVHHDEFNYSRTGAVTRPKVVLSDEELAAIMKAKSKAKTQKILDEKEEIKLDFLDPEFGYEVRKLTFNKDRANVSFQVKMPVELTLPTNEHGLTSVESHIYRNYTVIKDGISNFSTIPLTLSAALAKKLAKKMEVKDLGNGNYLVDVSDLPVINKSRVEEVSGQEIFNLEIAGMNSALEVKALKQFIGDATDEDEEVFDKSKDFPMIYTIDQTKYLNDLGITFKNGYSPKTETFKSGDFYMASNLVSKIAKFSAIPSFNAVQKKLDSGKKLTDSEQAFHDAITSTELKYKDNKTGAIEALKVLQKDRKDLLLSLANLKFSAILSRKEFKDIEMETSYPVKIGVSEIETTAQLAWKEEKVHL